MIGSCREKKKAAFRGQGILAFTIHMRSDFEKVLSVVDLSLKAIWSAFLLLLQIQKKINTTHHITARFVFSLFWQKYVEKAPLLLTIQHQNDETAVMGHTMFEVRSFEDKNRMFEFD